MKVRMEIDDSVLKLIIELMEHVDPTNFMFKKIIPQLKSVMKNNEYPEAEIKLKETTNVY